MAVWPAELPPPLVGTLNEKPPNNRVRNQPDKGPAITRRRTTANIRPISFALMLTEEQVQILDDFFVEDTFSGSVEFDYTHPRTGNACTATFGTEPEYGEQEGVAYRVAISLEILP